MAGEHEREQTILLLLQRHPLLGYGCAWRAEHRLHRPAARVHAGPRPARPGGEAPGPAALAHGALLQALLQTAAAVARRVTVNHRPQHSQINTACRPGVARNKHFAHVHGNNVRMIASIVGTSNNVTSTIFHLSTLVIT